MDIQKTGPLIRRLREAHGDTQKALAEKLHVTDKAVSKWERGLSCPDVSLLEPLAEQLGISVAELLQGALNGPSQNSSIESSSMPQPAKRLSQPTSSAFQKCAFCVCTFLFLASGVICAVCDLAVFGAFTWSLYPIASLIFAWAILSPLLQHGRKGILGSLVSLSLAIFPYLFTLAWLLHMPTLFLPVSFSMSVIGLAFLWCVYWIMQRLAQRRMLAFAACALMTVFLHLAVNYALSRLIQIPFLDAWDLLTIAIFLCMAVFFLRLDRKAHTAQEHQYPDEILDL